MGAFKISEVDRIVLSKYLDSNPEKSLEILSEMIYQSDETKLTRNTIITYLSRLRTSMKPKKEEENKSLFENEFQSGIEANDVAPEKEIFNDVTPTQYEIWKKHIKKMILELDHFEPNRDKGIENFGKVQGLKEAIELFESIKIQ